MKMSCSALAALLLGCLNQLQALPDAIVLRNGERKHGRIEGIAEGHILLMARPVPGLEAVTLRIPEARVQSLEFGADPERDAVLQGSAPNIADLEAFWNRLSPFLSVRTAPTAKIGLKLGIQLLETKNPHDHSKAMSIFESIAQSAPRPEEREAAQQGILRTLLATNKAAEARNEAMRILKTDGGAALRAEAGLTLADISEEDLRRFLNDHPRWDRESNGTMERDRLYYASLDHYLKAALTPGSPPVAAQRGWLGALRLYQLVGDHKSATETAMTVLELHPGSACAEWAQQILSLKLDAAEKRGDSGN